MSSKKITQNRERIEKIIPLLWNSYQHMYTIRSTNIQNKINFLLIVVSFLPVISISLFIRFDNTIFLIPIFFQLGALLILLRGFFFSGLIPWFQIDETLDNLKEGNFYENLFAKLKALEDETWDELVFYRGIIRNSLWLVLFSIYSTILATIFMFFSKVLLYLLAIILTLSLFILMVFYKKERNDGQKRSKASFDKKSKHYRKIIDEWLKK